jgi:hypothetical protein
VARTEILFSSDLLLLFKINPQQTFNSGSSQQLARQSQNPDITFSGKLRNTLYRMIICLKKIRAE